MKVLDDESVEEEKKHFIILLRHSSCTNPKGHSARFLIKLLQCSVCRQFFILLFYRTDNHIASHLSFISIKMLFAVRTHVIQNYIKENLKLRMRFEEI